VKISYNWLKQYIDLDLTPQELHEKLTFSGIEVEAEEHLGEALAAIVTARIVSRQPHPNSDHLSVCVVFNGREEVQVVCGAPNCDADRMVALAPLGAQVGEFVIKKVKLRGVESEGMLCSERELGLSDNHDGILILPPDTEPGQSLADVLNLRDVVYEVEITPNRPALLGMIGVARDLAAQLGKPLRLPQISVGGSRVMRCGYGRKLDLRSADEKQLQTVPAIGPVRARHIVEYRAAHGLENPESLLKVENIGPRVMEDAQNSFLPFGEVQDDWQSIREVLSLENRAPERCPRYTAHFIRNVTVGPSPEWLQLRLRSVGLRPINNVVDVTNYVLMELGHPLHAFDYDKVDGHKIVVRKARKGETFAALDGETYTLVPDDLVIADAHTPIALAGVMGGTNSHITEATRDIVIEGACFAYDGVRRTSGRHKLFSDSSYRFERDMSEETALLAGERAAQLILEVAGGTLYNGVLDSWEKPAALPPVRLRPARTRAFLAVDIPDKRMVQYLEGLGCQAVEQDEQTITFDVPFWRKDLTREIDLVEEIIRLHGYNNVPRRTEAQHIMDRAGFRLRRDLADTLVASGYYEVVNWSFCDPEALDWMNLAADDPRRQAPRLANPIGARFAIMQPTLLPGVLKCLLHNLSRGQKDLKLFELNKTYLRPGTHLAQEDYHVCGAQCGLREEKHWSGKTGEADFFDVKGAVENLLQKAQVEGAAWIPSREPFYMSGQGADVMHGELCLGSVGQLDPKLLLHFGLDMPVFSFNLSLGALRAAQPTAQAEFEPISKYPPVLRDISMLIAQSHPVEEVMRAIRAVQPDMIREVKLFDEFRGKQIPQGYRSLSFGMLFHSDVKTLTDETINALFTKVVNKLQEKFQIELR